VLKMTNTGYDNNAEVLHNRAAGYTKAGSALRNARYIDMSVPYSAGGLYSTVGDLLLWDQALYTEKLVSQRGLDEMFTPQKELVGYGWAISTLFNRKMEHHNGGIDGFDSNIARFPDDKVFIVVLSNVEGTAVDDITKDLAAIVFGEKYKLPAARKIIQLSSAQHNSYVGTYRITADIALTITFENDHLIGELSGGAPTKFELFPESETDFFSEDPPVKIVFAKDRTGAISECTVNGEYTGKKVQQ